MLCSLHVRAEEMVKLTQGLLSGRVQQGMEKWSEKVKVIVRLSGIRELNQVKKEGSWE